MVQRQSTNICNALASRPLSASGTLREARIRRRFFLATFTNVHNSPLVGTVEVNSSRHWETLTACRQLQIPPYKKIIENDKRIPKYTHPTSTFLRIWISQDLLQSTRSALQCTSKWFRSGRSIVWITDPNIRWISNKHENDWTQGLWGTKTVQKTEPQSFARVVLQTLRRWCKNRDVAVAADRWLEGALSDCAVHWRIEIMQGVSSVIQDLSRSSPQAFFTKKK